MERSQIEALIAFCWAVFRCFYMFLLFFDGSYGCSRGCNLRGQRIGIPTKSYVETLKLQNSSRRLTDSLLHFGPSPTSARAVVRLIKAAGEDPGVSEAGMRSTCPKAVGKLSDFGHLLE